MAEGSAEAEKSIVCRFYATTGCREGDKCAFLHKRPDTLSVLDSVCRFYLVGKCIYGNTCRFSHIRPLPRPSTSRASSTKAEQTTKANVKLVGLQKNVPPAATNIIPTQKNNTISSGSKLHDWANAPEFVPQIRKSYADVLKPEDAYCQKSVKPTQNILCPYFEVGECPNAVQCCFVHGDVCEMCGKACLLPFDNDQQKKHRELCEQELVKDMELSFAVQRSADKTCGICMDTIMEKEGVSNRRFGILEKCNHIFCLPCIRKWREVKRGEAQTADNMSPNMTRACPECRVPSDFITPSQYWVDNESEKKKLIDDYKEAMRKKPCKYFDQGRGNCPFAGACFYLHAYPDGTIAKLGPPKPRRRRNQNGDVDLMDQVMLWDFLELREESGMMHVDWDDFIYDFSDSDDSERSDTTLW